jgi:hypothetical protein
MCLTVKKTKREQTTRRDYLVYKIVKKDTSSEWISNIRNFHYNKGRVYTAKLSPFKSNNKKQYNSGLHYYVTLQDAKKELQLTASWVHVKRSIIECLLPKGTRFIEGKQGRRNVGVCTKLKILGEVK